MLSLQHSRANAATPDYYFVLPGPSTVSVEVDCPAGWYANGGNGACVQCPAGEQRSERILLLMSALSRSIWLVAGTDKRDLLRPCFHRYAC